MHSAETPSTNGDNGLVETRDCKGRFLPGNPGGPGNPQARNVATWRKALADTVSFEDVTEVTQKLVDAAKAGEPWAVHELFDRLLGKPHVSVDASVSVAGGGADADADADARGKARCDAFLAACEREERGGGQGVKAGGDRSAGGSVVPPGDAPGGAGGEREAEG